jgi:3-phenylpropionate/trans-cinnamate dioxygenase ferredoxin reductase component
MAERVVIVGAGHAGGTAAALLRQYGFEGEIALIGEEAAHPYQRPPLSKAWLKGEAGGEDLELKGHDFYAEHAIDLRLGVRVEAIDPAAKTVMFDGAAIPYDVLILATGARARPLPIPGAELPGVLFLRTVVDAEALKQALTPGKRLAVIGGGYIGLEAAASARSLGCEVAVVELEDRVLARVASTPLSQFFQAYHEARGVEFDLRARVVAIEGKNHVEGVRLEDGRLIACDLALIGVGAIPNIEIAKTAGITVANGVVVDEHARTSDPSIYAIGDVTWRPMPLYDCQFRLESVPNALEQAKQAACAIAGRPPPAPEVPWFWSDQYDLKLQIAGVPFDSDELLIRGDPQTASFAVFHLKGDRVMAVEAVNAGHEFMGGKLLIASRKPVDKTKLADPAVSMKAVTRD